MSPEPRDITGIELIPPAPAAPRWPLWLGLGVVLVSGLCLAGWRLGRRWRQPPPPLPPDRWALAELERIEAMGLPDAGAVERYHTLICDVVRTYLERRFNLEAPRQTTVEFLAALAQAPQLAAPQQELLRTFLERCDLAKFAPIVPTPEECREVLATARDFVAQTSHDGSRPSP